jgi:predicted PurR-regulated permease PerM
MIVRRNPPTNPQRPARSPRPQRDADEKWARRRDMALSILGWSLVIAGVLWLASHIVHTLLMLALAALFAYALAPGVALLHRRLPKWLAVIIVYVIVLAIVAAVFSLLISAIITEVTALATQVTSVLSPNAASANTPLFRALKRFGVSTSQIVAARDWATHQLAGAAGAAAVIVTGLFSGLLDVVLVTVLSIYLLIDGPRIIAWLRHDLPLSQRTRGEFMLDTFERVAGGYVRGELILCTLIGVLVGVGMQFIGVPFATLLGVLAFFFEFIPFLGPLFSAVACLLVGASLGWVTMIIILVYFIFIHIIEGYVVGPRVLGRSLGLHPAISIVALLVGGEVFGLWGALFAAPIAGIVQVVLSALWMEWRESHPTQFPDEDGQAEEDLPEPALNIFSPPPDAATPPATPDDARSGAPGQAIKPGAAQHTAQPDAPPASRTS